MSIFKDFVGSLLRINQNGVTPDHSGEQFEEGVEEKGCQSADPATELIERTVKTVRNASAKEVGSYAFYGCKNLTRADFSAATSIADNAFNKCTGLIKVNVPEVTTIGNSVFSECTGLAEVDFPMLTKAGSNAFAGTSLTKINFPMLTTILGYAFASCCNLTEVNLPRLNSTSSSIFSGCTGLTQITLPIVPSLYASAFEMCTSLVKVDLPALTSIGESAFYNCAKLATLILRSETICTLSDARGRTFGGTLLASGKGYIYVPKALVDTYKAADKWSTYANQFRALEDYTVDGTITGALDETKI